MIKAYACFKPCRNAIYRSSGGSQSARMTSSSVAIGLERSKHIIWPLSNAHLESGYPWYIMSIFKHICIHKRCKGSLLHFLLLHPMPFLHTKLTFASVSWNFHFLFSISSSIVFGWQTELKEMKVAFSSLCNRRSPLMYTFFRINTQHVNVERYEEKFLSYENSSHKNSNMNYFQNNVLRKHFSTITNT